MSEQTNSEKPPEPAPPEKPPEAQWQKPPGYDPVDLDALGVSPEAKGAIEARIRHLYSQAKAGTEAKREARELREHLDKLTPVVNQLAERSVKEDEAKVTQAIKQAREVGDVDTEVKLITALNQPKAEPKPQARVQEDVTHKIVKASETWATEVGDDGTLKRPWIMPTHPDHDRATGTLFRIKNEWGEQGMEINEQTLPLLHAEIDRRMGPKPNGSKQPQVLSTAQIQPKAKTDDMELSQDEKFTADRLYSHIKEPAKRLEAYTKSRNLLRAQGRAK